MVLLDVKGFAKVVKMAFGNLCSFAYLTLYALVMGLVSLSVWLYKHAKRLVNTYPKTILLIVCIAFAFDHVAMMVHYRVKAEKQNIRFDSLAALKDSIQNISAFDSGYARGLVDGNQILQIDGYKQEKGIIHRP